MTPDNAFYYQVAYVCAAMVYTAYAVSLIMRTRRLRARLAARADEASSR